MEEKKSETCQLRSQVTTAGSEGGGLKHRKCVGPVNL